MVQVNTDVKDVRKMNDDRMARSQEEIAKLRFEFQTDSGNKYRTVINAVKEIEIALLRFKEGGLINSQNFFREMENNFEIKQIQKSYRDRVFLQALGEQYVHWIQSILKSGNHMRNLNKYF